MPRITRRRDAVPSLVALHLVCAVGSVVGHCFDELFHHRLNHTGNSPKGINVSYYPRWQSVLSKRCTFAQLRYLILSESDGVNAFTDLALASCYVSLPPNRASIKAPIHCAALLLPCILYWGSKLLRDRNGGLWFPLYAGWVALDTE